MKRARLHRCFHAFRKEPEKIDEMTIHRVAIYPVPEAWNLKIEKGVDYIYV